MSDPTVEAIWRVLEGEGEKLKKIGKNSKAENVVYSYSFGIREMASGAIKGVTSFAKLVNSFFENVPNRHFPSH